MISTKSGNLTYGLNDSVPFRSLVPLVLQQVALLSVELAFPVIIVNLAGGSTEQAQSVVSLMMIAMGVGTILQALGKGPIGSGYFCAHETGTAYFPAAIMAIKAGGFPLLCGMTVVAGVFQMLLSRLVKKMRILFPPEIIGLIITMMAFMYIGYSVPYFFGLHESPVERRDDYITSGVTLVLVIAMYIWGNQRLREYALLIGIAVGYVVSFLSGGLDGSHFNKVYDAPLFALPTVSHGGWSFDGTILLAFLLAAFCSSIITVGNITTSQKINDSNWKRMDMPSVGNGLLAEGLSTVTSGLLGALPQTTSPGSVGLTVATGATSRHIAYGLGGFFILLAFFPKVAAAFAIMPKAVMGTIILVEIAFILPAGMQICVSRMLDYRRLFMLGISFAFGFAIDIVPQFTSVFPEVLRPLFQTPLALAAVTAIVLHLIFRVGIASRESLELDLSTPTDSYAILNNFMQGAGGEWGARTDVISRATAAINELIETTVAHRFCTGKMKIDAAFEEFNLSVDIYYEGTAMDFPKEKPNQHDILHDDLAVAKLSGYLINNYADKIAVKNVNETCHIHMNFEH
ncbi:MAG: solute carrier family 23 protein [Sporomusaceae bacterium]|nr:solute carrier family 23 protein [Sporomusaceae bacterium]